MFHIIFLLIISLVSGVQVEFNAVYGQDADDGIEKKIWTMKGEANCYFSNNCGDDEIPSSNDFDELLITYEIDNSNRILNNQDENNVDVCGDSANKGIWMNQNPNDAKYSIKLRTHKVSIQNLNDMVPCSIKQIDYFFQSEYGPAFEQAGGYTIFYLETIELINSPFTNDFVELFNSARVKYLKKLVVSDTRISGDITTMDFSRFADLEHVDLHNTKSHADFNYKLDGIVPLSLCTDKIKYLDLSGNEFTGLDENWDWDIMTSLEYLDLSNNPSFIADLDSLLSSSSNSKLSVLRYGGTLTNTTTSLENLDSLIPNLVEIEATLGDTSGILSIPSNIKKIGLVGSNEDRTRTNVYCEGQIFDQRCFVDLDVPADEMCPDGWEKTHYEKTVSSDGKASGRNQRCDLQHVCCKKPVTHENKDDPEFQDQILFYDYNVEKECEANGGKFIHHNGPVSNADYLCEMFHSKRFLPIEAPLENCYELYPQNGFNLDCASKTTYEECMSVTVYPNSFLFGARSGCGWIEPCVNRPKCDCDSDDCNPDSVGGCLKPKCSGCSQCSNEYSDHVKCSEFSDTNDDCALRTSKESCMNNKPWSSNYESFSGDTAIKPISENIGSSRICEWEGSSGYSSTEKVTIINTMMGGNFIDSLSLNPSLLTELHLENTEFNGNIEELLKFHRLKKITLVNNLIGGDRQTMSELCLPNDVKITAKDKTVLKLSRRERDRCMDSNFNWVNECNAQSWRFAEIAVNGHNIQDILDSYSPSPTGCDDLSVPKLYDGELSGLHALENCENPYVELIINMKLDDIQHIEVFSDPDHREELLGTTIFVNGVAVQTIDSLKYVHRIGLTECFINEPFMYDSKNIIIDVPHCKEYGLGEDNHCQHCLGKTEFGCYFVDRSQGDNVIGTPGCDCTNDNKCPENTDTYLNSESGSFGRTYSICRASEII